VPLTEAGRKEEDLQLPFDADHIKAAPNVDSDVQLTSDEEHQLYRHYDTGHPPENVPDDTGEAAAAPAGARDDAMTRSEEEVTFQKRRRPRERVRLKKYVVTDYVKKTVPVQREKVRLEYDDEADDHRRD
jgi:hypothetical protein